MNQPIVRLFGLVILMFAVLLAFTSRWTIFEASSLRNDPLNARALLEQERIDRGRILAADGTVLARSVRSAASSRSESVFERRYPTGEEFAHAIGYYFTNLGRTGLERFRNKTLNGQSGTNLQTILDQLQGKKRQGNEVTTTLDPAAQQVANKALAGHEGAVVALEPRSGALRVMASSPAYNPNDLRSTKTYEHLAKDSQGRPLVNRATQFGYAPGSTFKVVTATAAIDSGAYSKDSPGGRAQRAADLRRAAAQRLQRELRSDHADAGPGEIGEHGVGAGGRAGGQAHDGALHAPFRLRLKAAAGLPGRRDVLQRRVQRHAAWSRRRARRWMSGGWASARTNWRRRRCRWPRWPRRSPTAGS